MHTKKFDTIILKDTLPNSMDYWNLFQTTGWNNGYNFSINDLEIAIENSWYICSLYISDELIGFGRVIADGIHHALIVDLIIHPKFQGNGLGTKLLNRLVSKCKDSKIRDIQLFAAKDKFSFYEKLGFNKRPHNAPGMELVQQGIEYDQKS